MKTGRMLTTVSAMAFGLALAGAVPAMAQSATAGGATGNSTGMDQTTAQNGAAPTAAPQTNGAPGTATRAPGTNNMGSGSATSVQGTTSNGTMSGTAAMGNASGTGTTGTVNNTTGMTNNTTMKKAMPSHMSRTGMTTPSHHVTHTASMTHSRTMARRSSGQYQNPTAQDPEVARLNQMSLQAAQQGHSFTPSGGRM